jgi:tyrosyl-tRNA synthetase
MVAYIGFDPTADSLHVGHLQQITLLSRFAAVGHTAIALVGGGTGMIGDPSEKSEERNLLNPDQLAANRAGVGAQISRLLDAGPGRVILEDNAEWLEKATLIDFLRDVGKLFSVNEMIRKDSVRGRLEGRESSLSFTEFSYMLLQAWDFVQLYDRHHCELQLGGSDQWGNITEGVDLIRRLRGTQAFGLTSPLVTKADGSKFGKTESGTIWLDPQRTSPYDFYQFWLRATDRDVGPYLRRFTFLAEERIKELDTLTAEHPERREAQRVLAGELTSMVHGETEARRAAEASTVLFTDDISTLDAPTLEQALSDAPTTTVERRRLQGGLPIIDALITTGLAQSKGDARRKLDEGAVYLNGARVGQDRVLTGADALHGRWIVIRRGKAHQHVLSITDSA